MVREMIFLIMKKIKKEKMTENKKNDGWKMIRILMINDCTNRLQVG